MAQIIVPLLCSLRLLASLTWFCSTIWSCPHFRRDKVFADETRPGTGIQSDSINPSGSAGETSAGLCFIIYFHHYKWFLVVLSVRCVSMIVKEAQRWLVVIRRSFDSRPIALVMVLIGDLIRPSQVNKGSEISFFLIWVMMYTNLQLICSRELMLLNSWAISC